MTRGGYIIIGMIIGILIISLQKQQIHNKYVECMRNNGARK
jgi:hypothetical protein